MEYWQSIHDRATATIPVWTQFFPTLKLGAIGLAQFSAMTEALPGQAQQRDNKVQAVDNARQAGDFSWLELRLISLKVPKIIEGVVDENSGLLDDLGKVYGIVPWSADKTIARCGLLGPVWESANNWQLAQVPPRPTIVR